MKLILRCYDERIQYYFTSRHLSVGVMIVNPRPLSVRVIFVFALSVDKIKISQYNEFCNVRYLNEGIVS